MTDPTQREHATSANAPLSTAVIDPVCGMKVVPERAAGSVEHKGTTYYFCGKSCVARFTADPEKFLRPDAMRSMQSASSGGGLVQLGAQPAISGRTPAAPLSAAYVCPMDPEVRESKPG